MKGQCLQILVLCSLFLINPIECHVIKKRSDLRIVPAPSEVPSLPPGWGGGCFYEGTWYPLDRDMFSEKYEDGSCSGLHCDASGNILSWDNPVCHEPTTPLTPTLPPMGCFQNGQWYAPGTDISQGSDGANWCYGIYCGSDGHVRHWDNFNCHPTEEITTPTTNPPTATFPDTAIPTWPPGCDHNGQWYAPDTDVSKGSDGNGWCHGLYCDANSNLIAWDDWNCHPTKTTEENTTPPTFPPTTSTDTIEETTTTTTEESKTTTTARPAPPTTLPDTTVPITDVVMASNL